MRKFISAKISISCCQGNEIHYVNAYLSLVLLDREAIFVATQQSIDSLVEDGMRRWALATVQGCLAHKKQRLPRTRQWEYA